MKKFQIFRYIKNLRYLILIVTLLGGALIYVYANQHQEYTAQTVIQYSNPTANEGIAPDGSAIDPKEIYSAGVITDVISDLGLSLNVDQIRSACRVEEVISEDEQKRKDAILSDGEVYNEFTPVYKITFTADAKASKGYVRNVLDSIVKNYFVFYSKKYIDSAVIPNNTLNITADKYDYVNCVEIMENSVNDIIAFLEQKQQFYADFRSARTGYTFNDLENQYRYVEENIIPEYYAAVLGGKLTQNKEELIKTYQNRRDNCIMEISNLTDHIAKERTLIDQFGDKVTQSESQVAGAIGDNTDAIIEDVEEHWNREGFNADTTYDDLIDNYVNLRSDKNKKEIELAFCEKILSIYNDSAVVDKVGTLEVTELMDELNVMIEKLNVMYDAVEKTANELNEYSGARNISTLSGTYVEEAINVNLYIAMALLLFFIIGCAGAILIGRGVDFWQYLLYTDKKTGTANRVKCDMVIDEYSKRLLDENFSCIVFKLNTLQSTNVSKGRDFGDTMLKSFGKILDVEVKNYGFVGYNNGNMFISLFENFSKERAESFVEVIRQETENLHSNLEFSYGIANAADDNVYEVRELLKNAIKRLSN